MALKSKRELIDGLNKSAQNMAAIRKANEARRAAAGEAEPEPTPQTGTVTASSQFTIDQIKR